MTSLYDEVTQLIMNCGDRAGHIVVAGPTADAIIQAITTRLTSEEAVEAGAIASAAPLWDRLTDETKAAHADNTRRAIQAAIGRATHDQ